MDRLIALLAAFVGLIALGGALLVHNNAETVQARQSAEIAALRDALAQAGGPTAVLSPRPEDAPAATAAVPVDDGTADALLALQNRIVLLEQLTASQTAELEKTRTALANLPPAGTAPATDVAALGSQPTQSATASAITEDGPTKDCIPLGTRFMAQSGDSFPICKTKAVVSVAAVNEGEAIVEGPGSVVIGTTAELGIPGCTIAVLSADLSGFAEMRVTCV
jgi:hypothetical protein